MCGSPPQGRLQPWCPGLLWHPRPQLTSVSCLELHIAQTLQVRKEAPLIKSTQWNSLFQILFKLCFSESVRLLVAAGAQFNKDDWIYALATDQTDLLQLVLEHRWISGPDTSTSHGCSPSSHARARLKPQELQDLLHVALGQIDFAPSWLPLLLRAGLEPSLLLGPQMFVVFSTLSLWYWSRYRMFVLDLMCLCLWCHAGLSRQAVRC